MPIPLPTKPGLLYLTEGGVETEIMFKHGYELPEFATFPLLDKPEAVAALRTMYERVLDVAAASGFGVLLTGLDYRASPDWGEKLGYGADDLAEMQHRCIEFLREVSAPYGAHLPDLLIAGSVGPRGDAYGLNRTITAESAQDYHAVQLQTLADVGVDCVWAATFNNVPEAVGISRAAADAGHPLALSFTLTSNHRLRSGVTLREAIQATDAEAGEARPAAYSLNCSHPVEFVPALEPGDWFERVRIIRPNAAKMDKIALCKLGHLEEGDPVELGEMLGALARRYPHVDIWGGCCGTGDVHLREIARQVRLAHAPVEA
ncbi:MAG: homocysteine S-methyltransferase family protein [Pseudomonadota bacterium]